VDPRLRGPGGGTLLHWLANLDHTRMLPLLLDAGLSLEDRDHEGRTPLHQAALSQDGDTIAALLAVRANPLARDDAGRTPAELLAYFRQGAWL
jgi:ankyrin repeat protein